MIQDPEALLVLGCGIDAQGELIDDSRLNAHRAADMWNKGEVPLLIMSGNVSYKANFTPPVSEAQAMKDYVVSLGVASNKVLTEVESKDTLGNAIFTRLNILEPLGITNVVILPGPNHSKARLEYLFGKIFANEVAHSFIDLGEDRPEERARESQSLKMLKRWLDTIADGDVTAAYQLIRVKHPGYSSDPEVWDKLKAEIEKIQTS